MSPSRLKYHVFSLLIVLSNYLAAAIDVSIGVQVLDQNSLTNTASLTYYWSPNVAATQARALNLQLSLSTSSTTNLQLTTPAQVSIKCTQSPNADPTYSQLNFDDLTVSNLIANSKVQVTFTISSIGLSPTVTCDGTVISFTPQIIAGQDLSNLKFTNSTKTLITVKNYPTISFDKNQAQATSLQISPFTSSLFALYFSEPNLFACDLTCSISSNAIIFANSNGVFRAGVGSSVINIEYSVDLTKIVTNQAVNLACVASSSGVADIYKQYQPSIAIANAQVNFLLPKINVLRQSNQFAIYGSDFTIPLRLDPDQQFNSNVTIQCGLNRFDSMEDLNKFQSSIGANSCPSNLPATTPSNLGAYSYNGTQFDWYFTDPKNSSIQTQSTYIFIQNSNQNDLHIERRPKSGIKSGFVAYLSVFCCDTSILTQRTGLNYGTVKSTAVLNVPKSSSPDVVYPQAPTNVDLLNPAYDPCNCDLTLNTCDVNCCCDKDCTNDDQKVLNFVCPTRYRRVFVKTIDEWTCRDIYNKARLVESDWFPILCIQYNTTVILGQFYSPNQLDDLIKNNNDKFLYQIQQLVASSYNYRSGFINDPYTSTQAIKTSQLCSLDISASYSMNICLLTADTDGQVNDFLRFPTAANSISSCVYNSPVRFLKNDGRIFCPTLINQATCQVDNQLIAYETYINRVIISNPSNRNVKLAINEVEYWQCPEFPLSGSTVTNNPVTKCNYQFKASTKLFDSLADLNACNNDNWTAINDETKAETAKISSDFYANSYLTGCTKLQAGNIPDIDSQADACNNLLAGVKYVLFWNGGSVEKILARVILTNVKYDPTASGTLKQMFELRWVRNQPNFNQLQTVQEFETLTSDISYIITQKSGIVGYTQGKLLISGYKKSTDANVDVSYNLRFSGYRVFNRPYCGTLSRSERSPIRFGYNISSHCAVQLSRDDLNNAESCTNLKRIVFNKLNDYFAASNYVSKNGNPNMNTFNESEWVNVYPGIRSFSTLQSSQLNYSLEACLDVPYAVNVYFLYTRVGQLNKQNVYEIVGTDVRYSVRDWVYICKTMNVGCSQSSVQTFDVAFNAFFIELTTDRKSWLERCATTKYPEDSCLEQVFYTWPKDYNEPDFFEQYLIHLGLIFGAFGFFIAYVFLFGFNCL